jgi:hypothetical protein
MATRSDGRGRVCGACGDRAFRPRFFLLTSQDGAASSSTVARAAVAGAPAASEPARAAAPAAGVDVTLNDDDSYHAAKVLRLRPGDKCEVVFEDIQEAWLGQIVVAGPPARARLLAKLGPEQEGARYSVGVTLAQAAARPAAIDYLVEKGTEVGVDRFVLVISERSSGSAA